VRQSQHPSRPFLFDGHGSHSTIDPDADAGASNLPKEKDSVVLQTR
jgi:hypothetical protein